MKTFFFSLVFSSLLGLTASAQEDPKIRKDVTYSTHNYKHPNKAATARKWATEKEVAVNAPGYTNAPVANYKHPVPGAVPTGGIVVPHTPQPDSYRNYKIQRLSLPRPVAQSAASESNTAPESTPSTGN